ncbi:hypothetical protein G9A89_017479 [Geosiphon pyriformis]|nr:hypothetical protein G9A89_017479 [Geosiphon pyriformis]
MQYPELCNIQKQTGINNITEKRPKTFTTTKFKVVTTSDTATLEYYQSIYTHCKQRFNISDGTEIVKRTLYLYIKNHINNYFLGNYNISEVKSNLYNNLVHYSRLKTEDLNSETLATYFQELNYNIIKYCEEKYPVQSKYSFDSESETETSNKGKQKTKQHSKTTPNTPILTKTTAKHLQTPEQGTKNFQSPKSSIQQQEPISTSTNLIDYLAENQSEKTELEQKSEDSENKKEMVSTYIAKIPDFLGEDIETSPQKWLDQVTKARDVNGWNAVRMLKTIPYFLKGTVEKWFENLAASFNDWDAFKAAFLEQFTDNNTSITLRNWFHNIKQESSKSVMTYLEKPNHYHTQPSYLMIPEEQNFYHTALLKGRAAAQQQNSSYTPTIIPPVRIAENANLSDIFPFEFEANESPFLLSNATANEQKAITTMYIEAEVEEKPIRLILDSGSTRSIITYQLIHQLKRNID